MASHARIAGDGHRLAIVETVELERSAQRGDLMYLAVGQQHLVEPIDLAIVLKNDLLPVRQ